MKTRTILIVAVSIILTVTLSPCANAQQSFTACGNESLGETGSLSWSVGQLSWLPLVDTSASLIQGVQQPYEIQFFPGIEQPGITPLHLSVYPNPVTSRALLEISGEVEFPCTLTLCSAEGVCLKKLDIHRSPFDLPLEELKPGIYLLVVTCSQNRTYPFKLIKH